MKIRKFIKPFHYKEFLNSIRSPGNEYIAIDCTYKSLKIQIVDDDKKIIIETKLTDQDLRYNAIYQLNILSEAFYLVKNHLTKEFINQNVKY